MAKAQQRKAPSLRRHAVKKQDPQRRRWSPSAPSTAQELPKHKKKMKHHMVDKMRKRQGSQWRLWSLSSPRAAQEWQTNNNETELRTEGMMQKCLSLSGQICLLTPPDFDFLAFQGLRKNGQSTRTNGTFISETCCEKAGFPAETLVPLYPTDCGRMANAQKENEISYGRQDAKKRQNPQRRLWSPCSPRAAE